MKVCLLTDKPDHPVLAAATRLLEGRHVVEVIDPERSSAYRIEPGRELADVYLLKAHSARALALAGNLEDLGARVVNERAATAACQDRVRMARRARTAGLPFPRTQTFGRLSGLVAYGVGGGVLNFPLIVKSRLSRRGDLVTRVEDLDHLRALAVYWGREPVVVQEFVANDRWDHKLWVIGSEVFAGLRRTPLDGVTPEAATALVTADLASGWLELARRAGEVFGLAVYGIDILATARGPVIVDVNAFPGCRNMPGAPEALAALVERFGSEARPAGAQRGGPTRPAENIPAHGEAPCRSATVSVAVVHEMVRSLVAKLDGEEQRRDGQSSTTPRDLRVTYLRRKPGRGLVVVYRPRPGGGLLRPPREAPAALVTVRLSEEALGLLPSSRPLPEPRELEGSWPGVVSWPCLGMDLQTFPADSGLLGLPDVVAPTSGSALADALAAACRTVSGEATLRVVSVQATPERYKPGSRCVVRYRVGVEAEVPEGSSTLAPAATTAATVGDGARHFTFFGKLYRDREAAVAAHDLGCRLWSIVPSTELPDEPRSPFVPRSLGMIHDLGLVLTAAAQGAEGGEAVPGGQILRQPKTPPGAAPAEVEQPWDALRATAGTLAAWHTSGVTEGLVRRDAGSTYGARAKSWAAAVGGGVPTLTDQLVRRVEQLAAALSAATPERARPVHGAFKPHQLVFCDRRQPVVTDLDGACLADPALDVGYFLAYLRPPGFWRGRHGARAWFAGARAVFVDAYLLAMRSRGADPSEIEGIRARTSLFEAALILKIASRRARRLNSPRPAEVEAVRAEIEVCLHAFSPLVEASR
jgi:glutathione synthase/RimK-type ligase-like ATP-grasp enzyme